MTEHLLRLPLFLKKNTAYHIIFIKPGAAATAVTTQDNEEIHTILKVMNPPPAKSDYSLPDNLGLEFTARAIHKQGQYINTLLLTYPCFVCTHQFWELQRHNTLDQLLQQRTRKLF